MTDEDIIHAAPGSAQSHCPKSQHCCCSPTVVRQLSVQEPTHSFHHLISVTLMVQMPRLHCLCHRVHHLQQGMKTGRVEGEYDETRLRRRGGRKKRPAERYSVTTSLISARFFQLGNGLFKKCFGAITGISCPTCMYVPAIARSILGGGLVMGRYRATTHSYRLAGQI